MIEFSPNDLNKIQIMSQNIVVSELNDKELPSDTHIIEYRIGNKVFTDAVRAYTMVDIFDAYFDKLLKINGEITRIKSGFGNIKPKLYGKIKSD